MTQCLDAALFAAPAPAPALFVWLRESMEKFDPVLSSLEPRLGREPRRRPGVLSPAPPSSGFFMAGCVTTADWSNTNTGLRHRARWTAGAAGRPGQHRPTCLQSFTGIRAEARVSWCYVLFTVWWRVFGAREPPAKLLVLRGQRRCEEDQRCGSTPVPGLPATENTGQAAPAELVSRLVLTANIPAQTQLPSSHTPRLALASDMTFGANRKHQTLDIICPLQIHS